MLSGDFLRCAHRRSIVEYIEIGRDDLVARFDVSCQGSVPESLIAFLASTDYESAVRNAVSLDGDADTMACIAGGIAEAFYGAVSKRIADEVRTRLPEGFLSVLDHFESRYGSASHNRTVG